jgi:hypothetical protein
MLEPDDRGVLMELAPSPGRRIFAVLTLYLLGMLLIGIVLADPPAAIWAVLLIGLGAAAIWAGEWLRRATAVSLALTVEGLFDSAGTVLARWDDIEKIERGAFALKPSNGFLLVLKAPGPRRWVPGVWWQIGRRVGVGGVMPMRPTRFMAEQIALKLGR